MKFSKIAPTVNGLYWVTMLYHNCGTLMKPVLGNLSENGWSIEGSRKHYPKSDDSVTYLYGSRIEVPEVELDDESR